MGLISRVSSRTYRYNMDSRGRHTIVCDNGTGLVKAGRAGADFPDFVFPSMVGKPQLKARAKVGDKEIVLKDVMCGDEASAVRQFLEVEYPMENGQVRNW